ncbi:MAG: PA14 domain-containing protein [bacterium]|nr:PA14 domain-containing protein [bacterium]
MKKLFKNSLFYFVVLALAVGNSFVSISFDFGPNIAKAQEQEPELENSNSVPVFSEWCSALLGIVTYAEQNQIFSNVADLNDNEIIDLSDVGAIAGLYGQGNNDNCYKAFENPEGDFHFSCENYLDVNWCEGLFQGLKDSNGSQRGDYNYSEIFDISDDGVINLTDVGMLATMNGDRETCYQEYIPPFFSCDEPINFCGDGVINEGETCDDANQSDGDGCTANCSLETTYQCEDLSSQNGWYGEYFNYLASHPDMNLPGDQWPDDGHGDPMGLSWNTDWYDSSYFKFNRVDSNLEFGGNFFPFDMAAEELNDGHDYHFGIHWRAEVSASEPGNYDFSATSDDDIWVYLDGVLVAENPGIHAPEILNGQLVLDSNPHIVDIFFAERHTVLSHMSFAFTDERLSIVPMPEDCQEEPVCGNQIVELGEECDGSAAISCITDAGYSGLKTCNMPYTELTLQSVEDIALYCVWNSCQTDEYCGDSIINGNEACDDGVNGSSTCSVSCQNIVPPASGGGGGSNPPDVSNVLVNTNCQNTQISWNTSKDSLTKLLYGETTELDTEYKSVDYKANHIVNLESLKPNTKYYYIVHTRGYDGMTAFDSVRSFITPSAESCGLVLGEKIEEEQEQAQAPTMPQVLGTREYTCNFQRPGGSSGVDADIAGIFNFPDGTLIRHECDPEMKVYIIRDQQKWHIPNLNYLSKYYFGKRIYNIDRLALELYKDWTGKVSGVKEYPDGSLLRSRDMKIYIIENGKKVYISNLEELKKYAGQDIFDVSDEVISQY